MNQREPFGPPGIPLFFVSILLAGQLHWLWQHGNPADVAMRVPLAIVIGLLLAMALVGGVRRYASDYGTLARRLRAISPVLATAVVLPIGVLIDQQFPLWTVVAMAGLAVAQSPSAWPSRLRAALGTLCDCRDAPAAHASIASRLLILAAAGGADDSARAGAVYRTAPVGRRRRPYPRVRLPGRLVDRTGACARINTSCC